MKRVFKIGVLFAVVFFVLYTANSYAGKSRRGFKYSEIDVDSIKNDGEYATAIPDYKLVITGLVKEQMIYSFVDIIDEFGAYSEPVHGYPLRLVVPKKYGMKWPKWIEEMEVVDFDYKGYWEKRGWSDYAGRDRPDKRFD